MRRVLLAFVSVLALLLVGALGYGAWKDPENAAIDATARAGAPGRFVALSHGITHYDIAGPDSGRTVVLVHGFSVPYYIWDSTAVALSQTGHRVVRYDLYGRGLSDRPDVRYDGTLFSAQLNELLDSLRVTEPVDLVGLSFGGFVTANFVAQFPARVRTLTLVDPMSAGASLPRIVTLPLVGPWIWQVMAVPGMADDQLTDFLHPEHYPTWPEQYRPQMAYKGFGRALLSSARETSRTDFPALYSDVAKTGVPVLLVWGNQDQTIPVSMSSVARDAIPSLEFAPIDSAGHLPHIEQSKQVHARMRAFFAAHPH